MPRIIPNLHTRNSPIFTGIYLASQSYRYAATKDEQAVKVPVSGNLTAKAIFQGEDEGAVYAGLRAGAC